VTKLPIIEINKLTKKFGNIFALREVSFSISKSESFALLGPNGAGKTTLVKILSTLLRPTSGAVTVNGHNILEYPEEVKRSIGVVSHNHFLYDDLTARENLSFYSKLYGIDTNVDLLLETVGLRKRSDDLVGIFSRGMKQRLSIARALIHDPQILVLDEPTVGLDIKGKMGFYKMIKELNSEGRTILLTTHYLTEAEELCDKLCILDKGEVMACGKFEEVKGTETLEEIFIKLTGETA
jgi:heme ABC exporter ATP-binding subunit CcmA